MKLSPLEQSLVEALPRDTERIVVAVSGGVDSVVLLHLLQSLAESLELVLQVAHLDHQIRPESAKDATFVRDLCAQWEIPCHVEGCDVAALAEHNKISLEMAGRQARREFLQRIARDIGADLIALAHHRDDQIETFLQRLLRGSGISGLSGMAVVQGGWWRPLLGKDRQQILQYAEKHQLDWVEDESNQNVVFLRNRLRQEIIPQLREVNPDLTAGLGRLIRQIQQEEDYWAAEIEQRFPTFVISSADGLRLARKALVSAHPALRMRVLREALRRVRGDLQRIEAVHLQAIDELLCGSRSQAQCDLPRCWVARRYDSLWIRRDSPVKPEPYDLIVPLNGEVTLPDGRIVRTCAQVENEGESETVVEFALSALTQPLRVRSWHPGDQFEPLAMVGHKRLKRFFSDNRIELEARLTTPLLVSGETILWVVGLRRSRHAIANCGAGPVLRVEWLK